MNKFDTDSLFIHIGKVLEQNIDKDILQQMAEKEILDTVKKVNILIENYVNDRIYREMQRIVYNSAETDFRIKFKQEIIAKSVLFVKKKKYSAWHINEEGATVDRIKTTGLEIVRSDTPEVVRPVLKEIITMILKGNSDKEISDRVLSIKKELLSSTPEQISTNTGVHNLSKYIGADNSCRKGTPIHVRSVANFRSLTRFLKIENKYEDIVDGSKVKIVYLKKNKFGFDSIAFLRWPSEFDKVIQIDYDKQIEKVFLNKVQILLEPMNKINLLNGKAKEILGVFF